MSQLTEKDRSQVGTTDSSSPVKVNDNVGSSIVAVEDCDIVPGTEFLADTILGHEQIHSDGKKHITLVPQPSSDLHDPLNWSRPWKVATVSMSMVYNFLGAWVALSLNPFFLTLMTLYGKGVTPIAWLTSSLLLTLGFANLITVPVAVCYGRRSAYLWSMIITLATSLWAASAKSYGSMLGARILMGVGTAGIETLGPVTIVDVCFLHERGTWNSIYFLSLFGGSSLGGVVSGAIAGGSLGWQWFFWVTSILVGVGLVGILCLMPETAYVRTRTATDEHVNVLHKGWPKKSNFSLFPKRVDDSISFFQAIIRPFQVILAPTVLYSALMFSFFAIMYLIANVAQSIIFQQNYNFTVTQTGFTNISFVVGQVAGLPLSGWFSDWVSMRATRRNGMVREPEMRLVVLIPTILITVAGLVTLGCTAAAKTHWVGPVMGLVLLGMGATSTCVVAVTYAIDCHKPLSGEAMLVATIIKNTLSFGFAEFTPRWLINEGLRSPFLVMTGVALFLGLCPSVLMYIYGKRVRRFIARAGFLPQGKGILAE